MSFIIAGLVLTVVAWSSLGNDRLWNYVSLLFCDHNFNESAAIITTIERLNHKIGSVLLKKSFFVFQYIIINVICMLLRYIPAQ